jgi:hypothetical protein
MYLFDSKWEHAEDGTVQTSRPLAATPIMIIRFLEICRGGYGNGYRVSSYGSVDFVFY